MPRFEYLVTKEVFRPSGISLPDEVTIRIPHATDAEQLASLMIDAYVGTIDYEGEDLDDARGEVGRYLEGEAYLEASRVLEVGGVIQAGALLSRLAGAPMVGYVMTRAAMKNRGLATILLDQVAAAVWDDGHGDLRAFITAGNTASERIFTRAGFEIIAEYPD